MTIIELNIAGYHVTHKGPDFTRTAFRQNWSRGWSRILRNARIAYWPAAQFRRLDGVRRPAA
jgi:hypothetical protein